MEVDRIVNNFGVDRISPNVGKITIRYFRIRQDNKAILIAFLMQMTQDSFRSVKNVNAKSFEYYFILI